MKKRIKTLTAALCAVVLLCGFSVTAYAGGGPEWEGLDPSEETSTPEPTIEPGEGFTEEGSLVTRDLLYDEHTNKQFITVQTSGGSTFYIVIDYDKPTDEDAEQYETYFFSVVDEADLLAALEASGTELPECTCTEKCVAGAINMDCPVCSTNMTECVGAEPEPEPVEEPEPTPNRSQNRRAETPGRSCSFWRWLWWAAEPGGISRSTAPSSSGPLKLRRTTGTSWKPTTIPRRGPRRTRTKRRATNEIHQQPL